MKNIGFLMLGWALGLFGPLLADLIQRPHRRRQLRKSLFIEFQSLQTITCQLVFVVASHNGTVDKALLEWLDPIIGNAAGDSNQIALSKLLRAMLTASDQEIQQLSAANRRGNCLNLKHYDDPFLTATISSLGLFTPEFQRLALSIHSNLALINQEIDAAQSSFEKTFIPSVNPDTYMAIRSNLSSSYKHIEIQARRLTNLIGTILQTKK